MSSNLKIPKTLALKETYLRILLDLRGDSKLIDDRFVKLVRAKLDHEACTAGNMAQTVLQYVGEKPTVELLRLLAAQFAARHNELLIGPLDRFGTAVITEWILLKVLRVQQAVWRETSPGAELLFECVTGKPAGYLFKKKLPDGWLSYLAYKIGFSRRLIYPDDARYLVGLQFWGLTVSAEKAESLDFSDWDVDAKSRKYNQHIIKLRLRNEINQDIDCPFDYSDECISCTKTVSQCEAAFLRAEDDSRQPSRVQSSGPG